MKKVLSILALLVGLNLNAMDRMPDLLVSVSIQDVSMADFSRTLVTELQDKDLDISRPELNLLYSRIEENGGKLSYNLLRDALRNPSYIKNVIDALIQFSFLDESEIEGSIREIEASISESQEEMDEELVLQMVMDEYQEHIEVQLGEIYELWVQFDNDDNRSDAVALASVLYLSIKDYIENAQEEIKSILLELFVDRLKEVEEVNLIKREELEGASGLAQETEFVNVFCQNCYQETPIPSELLEVITACPNCGEGL